MKLTILVIASALSFAQPWSGILPSGTAITWTVGLPSGIPSGSWTQSGSTILAATSPCNNGSGDCTSTINTALASCGTNHYVLLGSGTFSVTTINVPATCELRGSGPNSTILSAAGTGSNGVVVLGAGANSAPSTANDTSITGGLSAGSTSITVASAAHISIGSLLSISELNNQANGVSITGSEGPCTFCDGNYSGTRADGQTVLVTNVSGTTITISPGLYQTYGSTLPNWAGSTNYGTNAFITSGGHYYQQTAEPSSPYVCVSGGTTPSFSTSGGSVSDGTCTWADKGAGTTTLPLATPFTPTVNAGVSKLQVYANNTGAGSNFVVNQCEYCWVSQVVGNYVDGDHADVFWSFGGEIVDSYFSNAMLHTPGTFDDALRIAEKTSQFLIQNNIIERLHVSVLLEWGASGNVVAYNCMLAGFDTGSPSVVIGGIDHHGAHTMFNLHEGNVMIQDYRDSVWGTSYRNTAFREWVQGSAAVDNPIATGRNTVTGGATVTCSSIAANKTCYPFQASRAFQESYLATTDNFVGNVVGSTNQSSNIGYSGGVTPYNSGSSATTDALLWPTTRVYDTTVYGWSFGFGESADTGTWSLDSTTAGSTAFMHGNYGNISGQIVWAGGVTHTLPASFYLSSKPAWFGSLAYPAIGPDVTGGSGPGGYAGLIPAQNCYLNVMGGSDGAPASPLSTFNPASCYPTSSGTGGTSTAGGRSTAGGVIKQ
jgi:hypothetical protein